MLYGDYHIEYMESTMMIKEIALHIQDCCMMQIVIFPDGDPDGCGIDIELIIFHTIAILNYCHLLRSFAIPDISGRILFDFSISIYHACGHAVLPCPRRSYKEFVP